MDVGDKFILHSSNGLDYKGEVVNFNNFREPGMEYAIDIEGYDDVCFVGEDFFIKNNLEIIDDDRVTRTL